MRLVPFVAATLVLATLVKGGAQAGDGPVIVIPGKPGVPVIINGRDASYAVVEGDWGLARPGHGTPKIIDGPFLHPAHFDRGRYYPRVGQRPGYGRLEIEPPPDRRLPRPAESFHRSWSSQSDPIPASLDPPAPLVLAPQFDGRRGSFRHRQH
jgi:hypothetical protein